MPPPFSYLNGCGLNCKCSSICFLLRLVLVFCWKKHTFPLFPSGEVLVFCGTQEHLLPVSNQRSLTFHWLLFHLPTARCCCPSARTQCCSMQNILYTWMLLPQLCCQCTPCVTAIRAHFVKDRKKSSSMSFNDNKWCRSCHENLSCVVWLFLLLCWSLLSLQWVGIRYTIVSNRRIVGALLYCDFSFITDA